MIDEPEFVEEGPNHYAYVRVTGEDALADLVAAIGLGPDGGWDRDDLRKKQKVPYGFTNWKLFSGLPRGAPVNDHIDRVFERLAPYEERFAGLGSEWNKYVVVTGYFEDPETLIGISVKNHRRAAVLGLDFDCDFYFDGM